MMKLIKWCLFLGVAGYMIILFWNEIEEKLLAAQKKFGQLSGSSEVQMVIPGVKIKYLKGNPFRERYKIKAALIKNEQLESEDIIETDDKSIVVICFGNNSCSKIGNNTRVKVEDLIEKKEDYSMGFYKFFIEKGTMFTNYQRMNDEEGHSSGPGGGGEKLRIRTLTVSMGIRGTQFMVEVNPDNSVRLAVKHGLVALENSEKKIISVASGQGTIVDSNKNIFPPQNYDWVKEINWQEHLKEALEHSGSSSLVNQESSTLEKDGGLIISLGNKVREIRSELKKKGLLLGKVKQSIENIGKEKEEDNVENGPSPKDRKNLQKEQHSDNANEQGSKDLETADVKKGISNQLNKLGGNLTGIEMQGADDINKNLKKGFDEVEDIEQR